MDYQKFFQQWGLRFDRLLPEIKAQGSPNRAVTRFIFQTEDGSRYLADGYAVEKQKKQVAQSWLLDFFATKQLTGIFPPLKTVDGEFGKVDDDLFFQVRTWVECDELPRQNLGENIRYGELWVDFLRQLRGVKPTEIPKPPNRRFYFADYLPVMQSQAAKKLPEYADILAWEIDAIQDFLLMEQFLPFGVAHGDFHPGNILVKDGEIATVIDWEFAGVKVAGYDLALLWGCLGIDNPAWLSGAVAKKLRRLLFDPNYISEAGRRYFADIMVATRLGWLAEWLELGEKQLFANELAYVRYLRSAPEIQSLR